MPGHLNHEIVNIHLKIFVHLFEREERLISHLLLNSPIAEDSWASPSWSWESATESVSPLWVPETQTTWASTCCLPRSVLAGSWGWAWCQDLIPGIRIWDLGFPSGILLTAMPKVCILGILISCWVGGNLLCINRISTWYIWIDSFKICISTPDLSLGLQTEI